MENFIINSALDMHLHLRDNDMLKLVGPLTSKSFTGALIMPNLLPPITTKEALLSYKQRIKEACKENKDFHSLCNDIFSSGLFILIFRRYKR
jgi:dihydroorotase